MTKKQVSATARPVGVCVGGASAPSSVGAPLNLWLPVPPSLNKAYRNGQKGARGRFASRALLDWKMAARVALRRQAWEHVPGPVIVVMNVERRSKVADIDNRIKPVLDLLVAEGVIEDDRHVTAVAAAWSDQHGDRAHIAIVSAQELTAQFRPSKESGAFGGWLLETLQAPETEKEDAK